MTASLAPVWRLSQPGPTPRLALTDAPAYQAYWQTYAPRTLGEILGQPEGVSILRAFVAAPCSRALLFHGPTGCGKTSGALALAHDLGVGEWGLTHVQSGRLDLERCDDLLREMRLSSLDGGWRAIVIDEADTMTPKARTLLLSWMECLGPRTVVVLTTNNPEAFTRRERSRFLEVEFVASGAEALDGGQALADLIWRSETGGEDGPELARLPNAVINGQVSYRSIASAMESLIRYGAPLCAGSSASVHHVAPPVALVTAKAAPVKERVARTLKIPVAATPQSWWDSLDAAARRGALRAVPLSAIPYVKVQSRVTELISRGSPPDWAKYLNLQPVIQSAFAIAEGQ